MPPKKILVIGATGNQGGGVVRHCLNAGHHATAYVRDASSSKAKALEDLGAKLTEGGLENSEALNAAAIGMDAVFFIEVQTGDWAGDLKRSSNVIEAARASQTVTHLFGSTAIKTGQHESFPGWGPEYPMYQYWLNKQATENMVRAAGFKHWTILRPAHFLQNLKSPVNAITFPGFGDDRVLRVAYKPDTKLPYLDVSDVGIVVAAALSSPEDYSSKEIDVAYEALTIAELAVKIGKALRLEIKVHYLTDEEIEEMMRQGSPMLGAARWANEVPGQDAVGKIPGNLPLTSVDDYLHANASEL